MKKLSVILLTVLSCSVFAQPTEKEIAAGLYLPAYELETPQVILKEKPLSEAITSEIDLEVMKIDVIKRNDKNKIVSKESFEGKVGRGMPLILSSLTETPYIKEVKTSTKKDQATKKVLIKDIFTSGTTIAVDRLKNEHTPKGYKIMFKQVNILGIKKFEELDLITADNFMIYNDFYLDKKQDVTIKLKDNTELLITIL